MTTVDTFIVFKTFPPLSLDLLSTKRAKLDVLQTKQGSHRQVKFCFWFWSSSAWGRMPVGMQSHRREMGKGRLSLSFSSISVQIWIYTESCSSSKCEHVCVFTASWYVVNYIMENKIYIPPNYNYTFLHLQHPPSSHMIRAFKKLHSCSLPFSHFPYGRQSDSFNLWVKYCSQSSSIFSSNSESNLKVVQSFTWSKYLMALPQRLSLAGLLVSPAILAIVSSKFLQYSKSTRLQHLGNHLSLH